MNILIPESLHGFLQKNLIDTITFGSKMKHKNSSSSDNDFLHIIAEPYFFRNTCLFTGHQLQYKEYKNDVLIADHVYVTIRQFLHNIIHAESGIPYEVLVHGQLKHTNLYWLEVFTDEFKNFQTARCFLGLAKRDLKDSTKIFRTDQKLSFKKLKFVVEGIQYVIDIISHYEVENEFKDVDYNGLLDKLKEDITYVDYKRIIDTLSNIVEEYRKWMQYFLDFDKIPKNISKSTFNVIGNYINESPIIATKTIFDTTLNSLYYEAMVNNTFK